MGSRSEAEEFVITDWGQGKEFAGGFDRMLSDKRR